MITLHVEATATDLESLTGKMQQIADDFFGRTPYAPEGDLRAWIEDEVTAMNGTVLLRNFAGEQDFLGDAQGPSSE